MVVNGLNCPEEILAKVEELGARHASYGVLPQHYTTVGEALLWSLRTAFSKAFTAETEGAWTSAYRFLATAMQRATSDPPLSE